MDNLVPAYCTHQSNEEKVRCDTCKQSILMERIALNVLLPIAADKMGQWNMMYRNPLNCALMRNVAE